jgi:hypothetical protein
MSGAIPPLLNTPSTPSWRGAQLKHRDNFTLSITTHSFGTPHHADNILLQNLKVRELGRPRCREKNSNKMVVRW